MCTVSIIGLRDGFRLVVNRDEARNRALARPPEVVRTNGVRALMPIDGESGGTWVAVTELGLGFALLNLNVQTGPQEGRSRGGIIPPLLACRSVDEAAAALVDLPGWPYRPFRLIVAGDGVAIELRHGPALELRHSLTSPLMFTSSGLGDRLVEAPRRALFERIMARRGARRGAGRGSLVDRQDRFHAHRWRLRPHLSVTMERREASTVSRTVLEVGGNRVHMAYTQVGQAETVGCGAHRLDIMRTG
jgi:hypothetical protein